MSERLVVSTLTRTFTSICCSLPCCLCPQKHVLQNYKTQLWILPQKKDQYRRATQGCNVSSFFYAKIYSLLARRRSSQPVQRVYWPENVIDCPEQRQTTCVMRYAWGHKLQRFWCKLPFCIYGLYSVISHNRLKKSAAFTSTCQM